MRPDLNITVASLPISLLSRLIFSYTRATKALIPDGRLDFADVLSSSDCTKPKEEKLAKAEAFLTYALVNRKFLQTKEQEFLQFHAANGLALPSIDTF